MTEAAQYPHLKPYTLPDHYWGETYFGTYPVYGIHRDSTILEQSNYAVLLKRLESKAEELHAPEETIRYSHASHWAVGWVDTFYVDQNAPAPLLEIAEAALADLEQYPILDESDYSDRQFQAIYDYWSGLPESMRRDLCREAGTDARRIARDNMPERVFDRLCESEMFF